MSDSNPTASVHALPSPGRARSALPSTTSLVVIGGLLFTVIGLVVAVVLLTTQNDKS